MKNFNTSIQVPSFEFLKDTFYIGLDLKSSSQGLENYNIENCILESVMQKHVIPALIPIFTDYTRTSRGSCTGNTETRDFYLRRVTLKNLNLGWLSRKKAFARVDLTSFIEIYCHIQVFKVFNLSKLFFLKNHKFLPKIVF